MSCAIKILYLSGILIEARYQIDLAYDHGSIMQILHLENKLLEQQKKAERICEKKYL